MSGLNIAMWMTAVVVVVVMIWLERRRLKEIGRCPTCGKWKD